MPVSSFKFQAGNDPLSVMLEDRGPQITFEMVNGYDLTPESLLEKEERNLDDIKTKFAYEKAKNRRHKKHIAALMRGVK